MASIVLGARFQTIWYRPQPRMAAHRPMAAARIQPDAWSGRSLLLQCPQLPLPTKPVGLAPSGHILW